MARVCAWSRRRARWQGFVLYRKCESFSTSYRESFLKRHLAVLAFFCYNSIIHGAYSLVVELQLVELVARVRFSLGTQDVLIRTWRFVHGALYCTHYFIINSIYTV